MTAPETIYLDGDASTDEGVYPRCFGDPKHASEPVNVYHHENICILRNDPVLRQVMEASSKMQSAVREVSRLGAQTGPQWTKLTVASLAFNQALAAMQGLIGGTDAVLS